MESLKTNNQNQNSKIQKKRYLMFSYLIPSEVYCLLLLLLLCIIVKLPLLHFLYININI